MHPVTIPGDHPSRIRELEGVLEATVTQAAMRMHAQTRKIRFGVSPCQLSSSTSCESCTHSGQPLRYRVGSDLLVGSHPDVSDHDRHGPANHALKDILIQGYGLICHSSYRDMPNGPEMHAYYGTDNGRVAHHSIRDNDSLNASYDRYLRNGMPTYVPPEGVRPMGGMPGHPVEDLQMLGVGDGRNVGVGGVPLGRKEILPPDASNTVFVEGLPANCTHREVSHICCPFVGFREVRLVNKESRHPGGDPLILCFVDFESPNHVAVALEALQEVAGTTDAKAEVAGILMGSVVQIRMMVDLITKFRNSVPMNNFFKQITGSRS